MTTSPYSKDLRKKVIDFLKNGGTQKKAADFFSLNLSTVSRWWLRLKREGHYEPRKRLGKKANLNDEMISKYLEKNPTAQAVDIGNHFNMTAGGARYWLKKLGYSYKKQRTPSWRKKSKKLKS